MNTILCNICNSKGYIPQEDLDSNKFGVQTPMGFNCHSCRGKGSLDDRHPKTAAPDLVNKPPHYTSHPSGVECITIVEHMNYNLGAAIKYIWRAGEKNAATRVEDLRKAAWHVIREIGRLEKAALKAEFAAKDSEDDTSI